MKHLRPRASLDYPRSIQNHVTFVSQTSNHSVRSPPNRNRNNARQSRRSVISVYPQIFQACMFLPLERLLLLDSRHHTVLEMHLLRRKVCSRTRHRISLSLRENKRRRGKCLNKRRRGECMIE
jgi:hypothetical protein